MRDKHCLKIYSSLLGFEVSCMESERGTCCEEVGGYYGEEGEKQMCSNGVVTTISYNQLVFSISFINII